MVASTGQRFRLSETQSREMWERWTRGERISQIASAMGRSMGSIQGWIGDAGGFAPRARKRAVEALSLDEREEISRGLSVGESMRSIATQLGRHPSTVSREIQRNGGVREYRAARADAVAWERAKRPQSPLLQRHPRLARIVASKLQRWWSPRQISGWLKRKFPHNPGMTVSHETIYRTLFVQARGALKKELVAYLRAHTRMRRPRSQAKPPGPYRITDLVSISQRPAEAEDRAIPGHWEGDLLFGTLHSQVATLVERRSRYLMLVKVAGKDTESVVGALSAHVKKLPEGLMRTLTWDRGSEMAAHKRFTLATDVQVYFCDPQSPWQRGSNENTNRLLRQFMPKGRDLSHLTQKQLDQIADLMNGRPRETLWFANPAEVLWGTVATTG